MTETNDVTTSYLCVKQSDLYPASHFRAGLFLSAITLMAVYFFPFNWEDPIWLLYIQVVAFFSGYLLAYTKKIKKLFTFRSEMKEEVHQKALESLNEYGLLGKRNHIFLFVSLVEKRIECLMSPELEEKVTPKQVQNILKGHKEVLKKQANAQVFETILNEIKGLFPEEKPAKIEESESPLLPQESSESLLQADLRAESRPHEEENQTSAE